MPTAMASRLSSAQRPEGECAVDHGEELLGVGAADARGHLGGEGAVDKEGHRTEQGGGVDAQQFHGEIRVAHPRALGPPPGPWRKSYESC
jgi:hypothetical protein